MPVPTTGFLNAARRGVVGCRQTLETCCAGGGCPSIAEAALPERAAGDRVAG